MVLDRYGIFVASCCGPEASPAEALFQQSTLRALEESHGGGASLVARVRESVR
ncbi:hypothetical protein ACFL5O_02105 [Myxococcota bacterium]